MLNDLSEISYKNLGRDLGRAGPSLRGSGHHIEDNVTDGLLVRFVLIWLGLGRI